MKAGTSIFFLVVKNLAKIGHKFETISIMLITFPFFFFSSFTITCVKIKITTVTCARENGKKHGDVKKLSSSSYQLRDGLLFSSKVALSHPKYCKQNQQPFPFKEFSTNLLFNKILEHLMSLCKKFFL